MLIDTHVHLGESAQESYVLQYMESVGADQVFVHAKPAADGSWTQQNNRIIDLLGPNVRGFCALHPVMGLKEAQTELARCLDAGMIGAGEFHPAVQGFTLDSPVFLAIARQLQERNRILSMYIEFSVGAKRPVCSLRDLLTFLESFPELKVILINYGGGLPFYELMKEVNKRAKNVYYDTSPSLRPLRKDALEITSMLVKDKLLYGSGTYIGDDNAPFEPLAFEFCHIMDEEILQGVASGNAVRLLKEIGL